MSAGKNHKPHETKEDLTRTLKGNMMEQTERFPKNDRNLGGYTPEQLIHEIRTHEIELETQAEELRRSRLEAEVLRDKFQELYDFAPIGIFTLSDKGLITELNLTASKLLGVSRPNLVYARFSKFIVDNETDEWRQNFIEILKNGIKKPFNLTIKQRDGSTFHAHLEALRFTSMSGETTIRLSISDISDIRQAEEALKIARDELEQQVKERTADLFSTNLKLKAEIDHRKLIAESLKESGKITTILNEVIITANKAETLQQLFKDTMDKALELLDFDGGGIYLVNTAERTATIRYIKNLPADFIEKRRTVFIDNKPYDTLFIRNEPIITEHYEELSQELSKAYHFLSLASIPLVSKNKVIGALNVVSTKRYTISDDEKQVLIAVGRELGTTVERMIAEEAVNKVSLNLQTLFDSINEMVFVLDMHGHILKVNSPVLKRLGFTQEELNGKDVLELHVPGRRDEALCNVQGMIAGTIDSCPVPIMTKKGDIIEVETKVTHGEWNDEEVLIGVSRDVTERNSMERALIQLSDRLSLAAKAGGVGIWDYDITTNTLNWDDQMFALYGITREQFSGAYNAWQTGLYPGDRERGDEEIKMALRGEKEFNTEFRVLWPDGSIHNIRALALVQRDPGGKPLRMIGTNWDISDQKNAEKALRENDILLRLILSLSAQFINVSSDKINQEISAALGEIGRFATVDRSYVFLLSPDGSAMDNTHEWCAEGISSEKENLQGLPTSMFPWWMEKIRRFETIHVPRVADLHPDAGNEKEILESQGIQSVLIVPLISQNELIGFLGFDSVRHEKTWPENIIALVTITGKSISNAIERERGEEALRRSEEQLSLALEGSGVGLWDWQVQTGETIFNERWAGILGYTLAELSPVSIKTWESLCHPDDLARSGEQLQLHFSGKTPTYECEARMKHKDGHWVWVLDRGKVVERDAEGRPARMTGTHLDITERVRHEEEIGASLREKETLLKEIHHRVKNNIQVISSLLNLQAKKIKDEKTLEIFRESQNRVKSIALIHEKLYRSKRLSSIDFKDFLQKLTENLFLSYGVRKTQVSFVISADDIYLPIDKAIPLGLITNELITNSLKYAFPDHRTGIISIDIRKDHNNYRYIFRDDGAGFPEDVEFDQGSEGNSNAKTLGLQLVIALVEQIQGTVKLERGNGTTFEINFMFKPEGEDHIE